MEDGNGRSRRRIIAFAGRNGCGKETAAQRAADRLAAPSHTYSDILVETYRLWGYEHSSRPDQQALSTFMRRQKGEDAMARVMLKKCLEAEGGHVVIDGVRRLTDIDLLIEEFGPESVVLVWIEASADNRYGRLRARKEKKGETMMARADFDEQELAETERQLDLVRLRCERSIDNDGPLAELLRHVDLLLHDLYPAVC